MIRYVLCIQVLGATESGHSSILPLRRPRWRFGTPVEHRAFPGFLWRSSDPLFLWFKPILATSLFSFLAFSVVPQKGPRVRIPPNPYVALQQQLTWPNQAATNPIPCMKPMYATIPIDTGSCPRIPCTSFRYFFRVRRICGASVSSLCTFIKC